MQKAAQADGWHLPGVIGAEVAEHMSPALEIAQRLRSGGALTSADVSAFSDAAERLQRIALASQQITRLASGQVRQSPERLDLAQVMQAVLEENQGRYARRGVQVEPRLQNIEVEADAGLLVTLCEVALECALRDGDRVQVWLKMKHWPEHAQLTIRARPHVRVADARVNATASLEWIYLERLAGEVEARVQRQLGSEFVEITVEFTRTVQQMVGLTGMETDSGASVASAEGLAGLRVLLISADEDITWDVGLLCRQLKLVVDVVPDCRQAVRFCELATPDMVILDEAARDYVFDELRDDILRQNINFPCLEIVQASDVIELGTWHGGATSRVSRSELRNQLQTLLTMELAKVV